MEISKESKIIHNEIAGVRFYMFTQEITRRISIKQITIPISVDNLRKANPDGLYDPA